MVSSRGGTRGGLGVKAANDTVGMISQKAGSVMNGSLSQSTLRVGRALRAARADGRHGKGVINGDKSLVKGGISGVGPGGDRYSHLVHRLENDKPYYNVELLTM